MRFPRRKHLPNFCPPHPSWPLIRLAARLVPLVLRLKYGQSSPRVSRKELKVLRGFRGCRLVLTPNHPDKADPAVIGWLAARAGLERPYVLANRAQFDGWWGFKGRLMQRLGAYSIARGTVDRSSFKTTRQLLSDPQQANQLLIYPEGGNYSRSESVFPFLPGVFGLIAKAQEELSDKQSAASIAPSPRSGLFVVPIALNYVVHDRHVESKIDAALRDLEHYVGLEDGAPQPRAQRIVALGERMLSLAEGNEGLPVVVSLSPFERLERMQLFLLEKVESRLGFSHSERQKQAQLRLSVPERTRKVIEAFLRISEEDYVPGTAYEETLMRRDLASAENLRLELERLQNWMDVQRGYLQEHGSVNHLVDIVRRFEWEIYGKVHLTVRRRCLVRLATPIEVRPFTEHASGAKKETREAQVLALTHQVEASVRHLLLPSSLSHGSRSKPRAKSP
ncbi:hypothetical protein IAD21_05712 [Abditibacteriota bacterium]|nr:hypothetical protein IAD21_05712 [Abditibacteriota bacterium]